ncbi:hypothetical protein N7493_001633 [Penicillium malachiteum]|uniref:Uncharacterized protein n=1 Tax=Penicillium malachiteum TaxID=1324776 RepID=A0AAD6HUY6_9EURO|nr:hypothetical protein N7493_001633 [Penicillium malachiteum]
MASHPSEESKWFPNGLWIGKKIRFPDDSIWRYDSCVSESEAQETTSMCEIDEVESEARAVFLASRMHGFGPNRAIIKVRLQLARIPQTGTEDEPAVVRADQAVETFRDSFFSELEGLTHMRTARCSSAPMILSHLTQKQADYEPVPNGYKRFILMEEVPGSSLAGKYHRFSMAEQNRVRAAFKIAWKDAIKCGLVHGDERIDNLIWDSDASKCYLVDWEWWDRVIQPIAWNDTRFLAWDL